MAATMKPFIHCPSFPCPNWLRLLVGLIILVLCALHALGQGDIDALMMLRPPSATAAPEYQNTNDILAYWAMESSTTWTDSSGNGRTLTEVGSIGGGTGIVGNDGTSNGNVNNYLVRSDEDWMSIGSAGITVAAWVKHTVTNSLDIMVGREGESNGDWVLFRSVNNSWGFNVYTNSTSYVCVYSDTNAVTAGAWYFVVGAFDPSTRIEKIRIGSTSSLGAWTSNTLPAYGIHNETNELMLFKSNYAGSGLAGELDEVGIWARVLTDAEITNIWNGGAGKTWPLTP